MCRVGLTVLTLVLFTGCRKSWHHVSGMDVLGGRPCCASHLLSRSGQMGFTEKNYYKVNKTNNLLMLLFLWKHYLFLRYCLSYWINQIWWTVSGGECFVIFLFVCCPEKRTSFPGTRNWTKACFEDRERVQNVTHSSCFRAPNPILSTPNTRKTKRGNQKRCCVRFECCNGPMAL